MAKKVRTYCLLLLLVLTASPVLRSQVLLIPDAQQGGMLMRQQLWSVLVNNLTGQPQRAILTITVADRNSSQPLMEASSGLLLLGTGIKRIMYNDIAPINWGLATPGFGADDRLNQPLPVGEYVVCYRLTDAEKKDIQLSSECIKVIAEPLSPPQLMVPENESVVTTSRPVFTWTPPAPVNMFSNLGYDIVVSPLYDRQSPQEALQRNIPVMTNYVNSNSIGYPSSFTDLEAGKQYVWQVAARDGNRFGGKSEVFVFTVMPDSVAKIISMAPYVKLDMNSPKTTVMHQGVLKMEYFNSYGDSTIKAEVYLLTEEKIKGKRNLSFQLPVQAGQNFLEYRLTNRMRLSETAIYGLRLINSRGEEWYMKFNPKYYF